MTQALPFDIFPGFSAAESLSLSTDGAIDAAHMALAEAHDMAAPHPRRPSARIARVTLKPEAVTANMATAIEKAALREQALTRAELLSLGLSAAEIDRHFSAALRRAMAARPGLMALAAGEAA